MFRGPYRTAPAALCWCLVAGAGAGAGAVAAERAAADPVPGAGSSALQPPGSVRLLSTRADGRPAARASTGPRLSDDGRWVVVSSKAALVRRDHNGFADVYLVDQRTGRRSLVSRTPSGGPGNGNSVNPDISGDGRYVTFTSIATDIVPGARRGGVYRYDRHTGETVLVAAEADQSSVSDDGRYVAFDRPGDGGVVHLADTWTGSTVLVSHDAADAGQSVGESWQPRISADGRFVAFYSYDDAIVGREDDNTVRDAFLWERSSNTSTLVSRARSGGSGNSSSDSPDVSADGRYVAFTSSATDLVAGVDPSHGHVYVRDMVAGSTEIVDVDEQGRPATDDDFTASFLPAISSDGDSVAFLSTADDLVASAAVTTVDCYVRHRSRQVTELASHDPHGQGADAPSSVAAISDDGDRVGFVTDATDLRGAQQDRPRAQVFVYRSRAPQPAAVAAKASASTSSPSSSRASPMASGGSSRRTLPQVPQVRTTTP